MSRALRVSALNKDMASGKKWIQTPAAAVRDASQGGTA